MKRFIFTLAIFILQISVSFALPSVTPALPDFSGQYVFYQDSSFQRESYIGVLYYDESTYAFRYYAPATGKGKSYKPEKNIHVLFTIDPTKENLELTGERIITTLRPEDTDLVNYIHEFFYEMTARRQNAGEISEPKDDYQNFPHFGGEVTLYFNPLIPIFNLERIESVDNKTILQIVTAGSLKSSNDQSFAKFIGIDDKFTDKNHKFKKDKKTKPLEASYKVREDSEELKASLDSSWNAVAENFYTLGNVSVFTMNEVSSPNENRFDLLKRRLLLGNELVYPNWKTQKIEINDKSTLITQISYHAEDDSYTYDFKFMRELDSKTAALYTMIVYAGAYEANKKYFDAIVKSFK